MKKIKLLPIICVIVLCFGLLAGCSSNDSSSNETTEAETEEVKTETTTATTEDKELIEEEVDNSDIHWPSNNKIIELMPEIEKQITDTTFTGSVVVITVETQDKEYYYTYVDESMAAGFDYQYQYDDDFFSGHNEEGYCIQVINDIERDGTMEIWGYNVDEEEDTEE